MSIAMIRVVAREGGACKVLDPDLKCIGSSGFSGPTRPPESRRLNTHLGKKGESAAFRPRT
jgi:hypothetical protein